nr:family 10 glycosylhydrolase [uncultured Anaerocolumna sp.]
MQNNLMKWLYKAIICTVLGIALFGTTYASAATDTKKPSITLTPATTKPTKGSVKVALQVSDASKLKKVKYRSGNRNASYFSKDGKVINLNSDNKATVSITRNDTYTFYAEDIHGNKTTKELVVSNIDKTAPVINYSLSTTEPVKSGISIYVTPSDKESGIKEVLYMAGKKTLSDFNTQTDAVKTVSMDEKGTAAIDVSANGEYSVAVTDKAGNQALEVIKITNIDKTAPSLDLTYSVMNQIATVTCNASDKSGIKRVLYVKGDMSNVNNPDWNTKGINITDSKEFKVDSAGVYTVLVQDKADNKIAKTINIKLEFKAVWISYLEFAEYGKGGFTKESFEAVIDTMFDNVVDMKMNAVVVQVRPFGDAMYKSNYFPWSKYISGTQGVDPGFDPLKYMVKAAHDRGLEFHAWLNPYRVTTASTDYKALSKDNPARVWYEDKDKSNDRNVLAFGGNLYYNPASSEVRQLIYNGVKEIVRNYDVDGIHFDDYFYPVLGTGHEKKFDNVEYEEYVVRCGKYNKKPLSIADWRRQNVNDLVKNVYKSVKDIDPTVEFGISPGGFINSLFADSGYYTDIATWLSKDGYIDYICPQIYWTFSNSSYPYDKTLDKWLSYRTSSSVKMYVGIANYKAGSSLEPDWKNDKDVLRKQVEYGRGTGLVDGYMFFRYDFFFNKVAKPGNDRLIEIL